MTLTKIEHAIRAAAEVTGEKRFVLIGTCAVIAWRRTVPVQMMMTREVDIYSFETERADEVAEEIDAALGQASSFDATHGFYVDGVGPETAILPTDWRDRAREWKSPGMNGAAAIVPEPNDIAVSKLCAGRQKDIDWIRAGAGSGMLNLTWMRNLAARLPERAPSADVLEERLAVVESRLKSPG